MTQLTNLVVNQTARNIAAQFGVDIEKARSGVYADNEENRKLHRVGQQYGGKKQEEPSKDKPKAKEEDPKGNKGAQKDERFSEDGIVGKDGGFNKQGKTYKRWIALREKVESGKATPEEKKEFAHLHNQYLNEKDRHAYEQSKQTDPKAKEPKYKTVDERRAEYKGKKEEGKEKEKTVSPAAKKLIKDQDCNYAVFVGNAQTHMTISCSTKLAHMVADGISEDSPAYKSALVNEVMSKMRDSDFTAIAKAVKKYGADVVKEAMISEKGNTVKESAGSERTIPDTGMIPEVADAMILEAQRREQETRKAVLGSYAKSFARNYVKDLNGEPDADFSNDYYKMRRDGFTDEEIKPEVERLVRRELSDYISPTETDSYVAEIWSNIDMPSVEKKLKDPKHV